MKLTFIIWLVVEPTHLKNMRTSNWVHLPQFSGRKFQKIIELPPPSHIINLPTLELGNISIVLHTKTTRHVSKIAAFLETNPPGPWFDLKHKKSLEKVAICMNLYIKCHPENGNRHPGSWRKIHENWPSPESKTGPIFSWEKTTSPLANGPWNKSLNM